MKMMLRAVRPRLRVLWTRHWTRAGKNLPWALKERSILNLEYCSLKRLTSFQRHLVDSDVDWKTPKNLQIKAKSWALAWLLAPFMMRARAKEWQKSGDGTILFLGDKLSKRWCLGPSCIPKIFIFYNETFCINALRHGGHSVWNLLKEVIIELFTHFSTEPWMILLL